MTTHHPADRNRALRLGVALVGLSIALGACATTDDVATVGSFAPNDYRQRHPIAIQEANRSIELFVGSSRGGLTAEQRADVMGLAQTWLHEGTGAMRAYQEMMYGADKNDPEKKDMWAGLLQRYCELDTLSMVLILEHWRRCVEIRTVPV